MRFHRGRRLALALAALAVAVPAAPQAAAGPPLSAGCEYLRLGPTTHGRAWFHRGQTTTQWDVRCWLERGPGQEIAGSVVECSSETAVGSGDCVRPLLPVALPAQPSVGVCIFRVWVHGPPFQVTTYTQCTWVPVTRMLTE